MSRACLGLVVSLAAVLAADAAAAAAPATPTGTGLKDPFAAPSAARVAAPDHDLKDPWARAPLQDPIAEPSRGPLSPDGLKDPWAAAASPRDPSLVDPYRDAPSDSFVAAPGDPALIDPFAPRSTSDLVDPFTDTRTAPDPDLLDPFAATRETTVAPPRSPDLLDPFAPRATPIRPPIQRPRARPPAAR